MFVFCRWGSLPGDFISFRFHFLARFGWIARCTRLRHKIDAHMEVPCWNHRRSTGFHHGSSGGSFGLYEQSKNKSTVELARAGRNFGFFLHAIFHPTLLSYFGAFWLCQSSKWSIHYATSQWRAVQLEGWSLEFVVVSCLADPSANRFCLNLHIHCLHWTSQTYPPDGCEIHLCSCSFLFFRFRPPGTEGFSIFLLIRNVIVAMAPVLPSTAAACFVILCVLCGNLCLSAMLQPWLFSFATYVDLLTNLCFLVILFQGAFLVENLSGSVWYDFVRNHPVWHFAALAGPVYVCIGKALVSKASNFFLTHHKGACGSMAPLIKVELQQRRFSVFLVSVFLDTDDLSSLTHLFAILSQNVRTLLLIASPNILTRKWCVGEITAANIQKVDTFVIALSGFHFPDNKFIEAFDAVVDGLSDLANYGLGKTEVREALRALSARKSWQWPAFFRPSDVDEILQQVVPSARNLKEPPRILFYRWAAQKFERLGLLMLDLGQPQGLGGTCHCSRPSHLDVPVPHSQAHQWTFCAFSQRLCDGNRLWGD